MDSVPASVIRAYFAAKAKPDAMLYGYAKDESPVPVSVVRAHEAAVSGLDELLLSFLSS